MTAGTGPGRERPGSAGRRQEEVAGPAGSRGPQPGSSGGVALGEYAPEFTAPAAYGGHVSLADFRGRGVLVVFVPFAFTPVCSREIEELTRAAPAWQERGVEVVVISCDAMPTLRVWAEQHRAGFEVLSDFWPHGHIARAYGAFSEHDGAADRLSVLIDAHGVVRWTTRAARGRPRPVSDYEAAVDALTEAAPSPAAHQETSAHLESSGRREPSATKRAHRWH